MENLELLKLIEICEGIDIAQQALLDQPPGTEFVYLEIDHPIKYWMKSKPEDCVGDTAFLWWISEGWEPSDDGAVTNMRLDHAPYYPIASLQQAVEITIKGKGHV